MFYLSVKTDKPDFLMLLLFVGKKLMLHSVAKKVLFSDFSYYEVRAHIDYSPKLVNSQGLIPCYAANQWAPRGGTWDFK